MYIFRSCLVHRINLCFSTQLICVLAGHRLLRNPVPCDLWVNEETGEPLHPVPVPDPARAQGRTPFATFVLPNGLQVVSVGRGGLLVNAEDYFAFVEYVENNILEREAEKAAEYARKLKAYKAGTSQRDPVKHVPFKPTPQALDFGMSLLWPSQSFASITLFRGRTSRRLGPFHQERFQALAG
jgi:hypothetical protein